MIKRAAEVLGRCPPLVDPLLWLAAGVLSYARHSDRRRVVRANQLMALRAQKATTRIAAGALELSTLRAFVSYARYWVELLRLQSLDPTDVVLRVDTEYGDEFIARRQAGQPTIAVLAHVGNWEWCGAWAALALDGLTAVAETLEDPDITAWFLEARRRLGMKIVLTGGDVTRALLRSLRDGELVALLVDRDVSGAGETVDFLGERIPLASGAGVLSVMSGAPIFPVGTFQRRHRRQEVKFYPPIYPLNEGTRAERVDLIMRQVAEAIENIVKEAPSQWHNFQPYDSEAG